MIPDQSKHLSANSWNEFSSGGEDDKNSFRRQSVWDPIILNSPDPAPRLLVVVGVGGLVGYKGVYIEATADKSGLNS